MDELIVMVSLCRPYVCMYVCMYVCQHFQTSSPLKPLGTLKPNFMWSFLGMGRDSILRIPWVHEPIWISKVKVIHWPWSKVTQNRIQHFQTSYPEKPLGRLNFMWNLNEMGEWKSIQMVHMTKIAAMPIYGKNMKSSSSLEPSSTRVLIDWPWS